MSHSPGIGRTKNNTEAGEEIFPARAITGAVWCDPVKYPQWRKLPNSFFDYDANYSGRMPHTLLEFRFFYEWDGRSGCTADFSAGCRFRLLINGAFAEDGPVEAGGDYGKTDAPDWWFGDTMALDRWLKPGRNEFRFQVLPVPVVQSDYTTGHGWVWCLLKDQRGARVPDRWQFRISGGYDLCSWTDQEEDAAAWCDDCVPVSVPTPLCFPGLPRLTNQEIRSFRYLFPFGKGGNIRLSGKKLLAAPGRPVTFFLALPRLTAGHFEVRAKGPGRLRMFFEFQELYGIKPDQKAEEFFCSKAGESTCRTFRIYPCRYVKVDLIPSSFDASAAPDEFTALEFLFWERGLPLGKKRAVKNLPEPWLKQLDDHCLNLLKLCMQRIFLDSPAHHEGLGCTGDYRIGANIAALAYGETSLAQADLFRTALLLRQQKKMFHTSYELCFVLMMQEYLEHSRSDRLVRACYDAVRIVFEHFKSMTGKEGLISEAENYLFIDWATDGGITYHHPPADRGAAAMTALWYGALGAMRRIAERIGKTADAEEFGREADRVRRSFNRYLWDPEKRAYADGIPGMSHKKPNGWPLPPEGSRKICSNIGNIMALAFGLPEDERLGMELLQRVLKGEFPIQQSIYYMEYLFMAAERYRLPVRDKLELLSRWKPFLKEGIRESWFAGDYSHMWSASPACWMRKKDFFRE